MDFIFITGKLGQGKSIAAVARIKRYIERGRPVATNCDLYLQHMFSRTVRTPRVMRVPDKPTLHDLEMIGRAYPKRLGYREDLNGLLVLDECGDWFNSRNWNDKSRAGLNSKLRHIRKLGWDVLLIVQDISLIDSQARDSLAAAIARCKRLDKVAIPFFTTFSKLFVEGGIRPIKLHLARVEDSDGLFLDRWSYRGGHLYSAYDTAQIFNPNYDHGVYSMLTPWHLYGRYAVEKNWSNFMRITKVYLKRWSRPFSAFLGSFVTAFIFCAYIYVTSPDKPVVSLVESTDDESLSFADRFKDWSYRGSIIVNGKPTFYLETPDGFKLSSDSGATQLKGVSYKEVGMCVVELRHKVDFVVLKCKQELVAQD